MRTRRVGDHAGGREAHRRRRSPGRAERRRRQRAGRAAAGHGAGVRQDRRRPEPTIPAAYDPVVEHPFTDWLTVLSNRNAPISVFAATKLPARPARCFSVEPSAASLAPVVDPGIFCFHTGRHPDRGPLGVGTLTLIGTPAAGPPDEHAPGPGDGRPDQRP